MYRPPLHRECRSRAAWPPGCSPHGGASRQRARLNGMPAASRLANLYARECLDGRRETATVSRRLGGGLQRGGFLCRNLGVAGFINADRVQTLSADLRHGRGRAIRPSACRYRADHPFPTLHKRKPTYTLPRVTVQPPFPQRPPPRFHPWSFAALLPAWCGHSRISRQPSSRKAAHILRESPPCELHPRTGMFDDQPAPDLIADRHHLEKQPCRPAISGLFLGNCGTPFRGIQNFGHFHRQITACRSFLRLHRALAISVLHFWQIRRTRRWARTASSSDDAPRDTARRPCRPAA